MVLEKKSIINQILLKIRDKKVFYVGDFYTFAKNIIICIGH